ncbi:MAG: hypothetical protein RLZZ03_1171 [Pseudomonadota bacterium]|jgi:hypothetical protein
MSQISQSPNLQAAPRPWWKEPYVWMVIAGPLSAVVACIITAFYILQGPDRLVPEDHFDEGRLMSREVKAALPPMQPANVGRNHSATGGQRDAKP